MHWFSVMGAVAQGAAQSAAVPIAYPADRFDQIYDIWLWLGIAIYLIVAIPMVYFIGRYRYRKGVNETGADEHGSFGIEVLWTVIPLIIVIYLAVQSAVLYTEQRTPPPDSMVIQTEGSMWAWTFTYPNGKESITDLYVPLGKPVKIELTSSDVIHAFHIPAAKTMEDAIPGRVTHLWFQFNETGEFPAFCREYCGTMHAYMRANIKVLPQAEYDAWVGS